MTPEHFKVGDVLTFDSGPGVTPDIIGKFFRVTSVDEHGLPTCAGPYEDQACTVRAPMVHPVFRLFYR